MTIAFNARGLRGPDRGYEKAPGVRRILILGDSFASGYYAEESETVRARLEAMLSRRSAPSERVEVLNAGVPGYSTDQEHLFFLEEGRRYAPDVVLLFFFSNDLHFNTSGIGTADRPKPYFDLLSASEIVLRNVPVPEVRPSSGVDRGAPSRSTWRGSEALGWVAQRTLRAPRLHRRLAEFGLVPPLNTEPPRDYLPYCVEGRQERWAVDDMWNRTRAILGKLSAAVTDLGARLVVVYVPPRFEVNDGAWRWIQDRYGESRTWNRDAVFDRLARNLLALELPLLDPREALRAAERSPAPAYLPIDGHWNGRGNEIVAEQLFERLAGKPTAAPGQKP